jgi:hypothetical protein
LLHQGIKNVNTPWEYTEYRLIKELNMSLHEINSLPENKIRFFIQIMNIEKQYQNRKPTK